MTIHSPQANCLAIVQNFGNFWGDCLNLTLLIKKRCTYYVPNFHSHRQRHREGGWGGDHWEGKFTFTFTNSHFLKISRLHTSATISLWNTL